MARRRETGERRVLKNIELKVENGKWKINFQFSAFNFQFIALR